MRSETSFHGFLWCLAHSLSTLESLSWLSLMLKMTSFANEFAEFVLVFRLWLALGIELLSNGWRLTSLEAYYWVLLFRILLTLKWVVLSSFLLTELCISKTSGRAELLNESLVMLPRSLSSSDSALETLRSISPKYSSCSPSYVCFSTTTWVLCLTNRFFMYW